MGTCGRITHLIEQKLLRLDDVNTFILDEADKLMEESFEKNIKYHFATFYLFNLIIQLHLQPAAAGGERAPDARLLGHLPAPARQDPVPVPVRADTRNLINFLNF